MRWESFETYAPAKWVLAGEHSVLRGATAVALPHPELGLRLRFEADRARRLDIEPASSREVVRELLDAVREERGDRELFYEAPSGKLSLENTIPIGAGLGSSAALCVALARWMGEPLGIRASEQVAFATQLEHRFHGRSSGMDVAVISAARAISFAMDRGTQPIELRRLPCFTFHDTGLRSRTSECVLRVERFREDSPAMALKIDEAMATASRLALEGLFLFDLGKQDQGLELLTRAMKAAQECFYSWELVPGQARRLEEELYAQGALAVKMTGAGGGGFLVALQSVSHLDTACV